MKKIYLLMVCLTMAVAIQAQDPTTFTVHLKNGTTVPYNVDDIDYLTFDTDESSQGDIPSILQGKTYALSLLPLTVGEDDPLVYQLMAKGQQVAEICLEYVRQENVVDEQMLVVYPIGNDGKADLTKGYTLKDGGSLVWNLSDNTCTYTAGSGTGVPSTLYLDNGNFVTNTTASEVITTTAKQYILKDVRGFEENEYTIVKIGTQYWMGENLRAANLNDGIEITYYSSTQGTNWNNTTAPANHIAFDDEEFTLPDWGRMYNGYAVLSGKLAPEGWKITMHSDWQALKTYLGSTPAAKVKSEAEWNDTPGNGNNLSGLNVYPGGMLLHASDGDIYQGSRATYWTGDQLTDATFGSPGLGAVTIYNSIMLESGGAPICHRYEYGHYIRCIRK